MLAILQLLGTLIANLFRSRRRLEEPLSPPSAQYRVVCEKIPKPLSRRRQILCKIAGGIGLFRELPCQLQSTFDSGMFSLRFRIVRSTSANGQARNWRVEFFTDNYRRTSPLI